MFYKTAVVTTLLNNRAGENTQSFQYLELKEINKTVLLEDGKETVLWSK